MSELGEMSGMVDQSRGECRYFLTYSGVKLPLNLVTPISEADTRNRNTYMRGYYDTQNRLVAVEKVVYGEIEIEHRYQYHDNGQISWAGVHLVADDELTVIRFDENGMQVSA
jgi:hypothetical protein